MPRSRVIRVIGFLIRSSRRDVASRQAKRESLAVPKIHQLSRRDTLVGGLSRNNVLRCIRGCILGQRISPTRRCSPVSYRYAGKNCEPGIPSKIARAVIKTRGRAPAAVVAATAPPPTIGNFFIPSTIPDKPSKRRDSRRAIIASSFPLKIAFPEISGSCFSAAELSFLPRDASLSKNRSTRSCTANCTRGVMQKRAGRGVRRLESSSPRYYASCLPNPTKGSREPARRISESPAKPIAAVCRSICERLSRFRRIMAARSFLRNIHGNGGVPRDALGHFRFPSVSGRSF